MSSFLMSLIWKSWFFVNRLSVDWLSGEDECYTVPCLTIGICWFWMPLMNQIAPLPEGEYYSSVSDHKP